MAIVHGLDMYYIGTNMNQQICQSCGMPMEEGLFGQNADGSRNEEYCKYCYPNGAFSKDETMEEMIESCIPFLVGKDFPDEETARKVMEEELPKLKRWSK